MQRMSDEQYGSRARSSVTMMSRLDRLDSMMRYIEGRQSSSRCGSSSSSRSSNWCEGTEKLQSMKMMMPLDTAIKEIHTKGSLLDRVTSLENRLFQLCLEVEGLSSSSSSSMAHKYENAPLSHAPSTSTTDIGSSSSTMSLDDQALAAFDAHYYCSFHQALAERFNFLGNTMDNNSTTQLRYLLAGEGEEAANNSEKKNKKKLKARSCSRRWRRLLGC